MFEGSSNFLCHFLLCSMSRNEVERKYVKEVLKNFLKNLSNIFSRRKKYGNRNISHLLQKDFKHPVNMQNIAYDYLKISYHINFSNFISFLQNLLHLLLYQKDSISKYNPLPSKTAPLSHLDDFIEGILEDNNNHSCI